MAVHEASVNRSNRGAFPHSVSLWRGQSLAAVVLCLISLCAQGATATHAPVPPAPVSFSAARIELSAREPTFVVTVRNDDTRLAMVIRLQPMIWTEEGTSHYALTSDVIAEPATLTVPPGTTQAVRVELRLTTVNLSNQDFELFWQARAEPWAADHNDQVRAAP